MKMREVMTAAVVVFGLAAASATHAAEATVGVDAASAYVFRGATFNDGFVLQPYMEVGGLMIGEAEVSLGAWGNLDIDDYDGIVEEGQFQEWDFYGSIAFPLEVVDLALGYTEYTYPSSGLDHDREFGLTVAKEVADTGVTPGLGVYYGVDGGIEDNVYVEGTLDYGMALTEALSLSLGGAVGYLEDDGGPDGFSHASGTIGLGYALSEAAEIHCSLTYVGQLDDDVLPDGKEAYDVDTYGLVGISYAF